MSYFPKPFTNKNEIEVELDLCNYALKAQQAFVHCNLLNLAYVKSRVDKLDIVKLETARFDLHKVSDIVKNEVVKKTECNELIKKLNDNQTTNKSNIVEKTDYNLTIAEIGRGIRDLYHGKYITTQEFNKSAPENVAARLKISKVSK